MDNAKQGGSAGGDNEDTLICPSDMTTILKRYVYEFV